jgi:hypothetical protein
MADGQWPAPSREHYPGWPPVAHDDEEEEVRVADGNSDDGRLAMGLGAPRQPHAATPAVSKSPAPGQETMTTGTLTSSRQAASIPWQKPDGGTLPVAGAPS